MAKQIGSFKTAAEVGRSAAAFVADVQKQFARFEGSSTRVITLTETYDELDGLTNSQNSLFAQSIKAVESGLCRAAIILAWAGFVDVLETKLASDGWVKAMSVMPTFPASKTLEEVREIFTEHAFVVLGKDCGLYTKGTMKTLHGALAERNQCAHPGAPDPGLNEALGYVSKLLSRAKELEGKSL